ncbi:hypothetical protein FQR65_LT11940 [Abscondita terminalis]|nr:hypothetical protein FQR65_LT11940 [Abscondita terminalis]
MRRGILKSRLTKFNTFFHNVSESATLSENQLAELENRLSDIKTIKEVFMDIHLQIMLESGSNDADENELELFENQFFSITAAVSRFEKIFNEHCNQKDIFDAIARPIIKKVFNGHNGTIFAYGQTGSGKTYTITGSSSYFEQRGIIPRSIEEIFGFVRKNPYVYTVYVSYLEIYNDVGYDLLNSAAKCNMELYPIEQKEKIKSRNVKAVRVCSEEEAMMMLLVGDSNRITVETARNLNSSRSHCIFTINIISKNSKKGQVMNSKLSLVDLAGSERICKSNISGITLKEAKCINLSLHYLQDVVRILCQKHAYVPFRNSLLTYMLKDSLGGNCVTVLLATLDLNKNNFEETISTCKFAQNVGQVSMEMVVNKIMSPKDEVTHLKSIIEDLQSELSSAATFKQIGPLSEEEEEDCKTLVKNYLKNPKDEINVTKLDMRSIRFCFKVFKQIIQEIEINALKIQKQDEEQCQAIKQFEETVKNQEKQIDELNSIVNKEKKPVTPEVQLKARTRNNSMIPSGKMLFKKFLCTSKNRSELNYYTDSIDKILKQAKHYASVVEHCKKNIIAAQEHLNNSIPDSQEVVQKLLNEQVIYKISLTKLEHLKLETSRLKSKLSMAMEKMASDFNDWYQKSSNCKYFVESEDTESLNILSDGNKENLNFEVTFNQTQYNKLQNKERGVLHQRNCNVEDFLKKPHYEHIHYPDIEQSTLVNFLPITNKEVSRKMERPSEHLLSDKKFADTNLIDAFIKEVPERDYNVHCSKTPKTVHGDSPEFKEFISKIPFTGDDAIDEEIINFYRTKLVSSN